MKHRARIGIMLLVATLQACAIAPGMKMDEPAEIQRGQVVRVTPITLELLRQMDDERRAAAQQVARAFSNTPEPYRIGPSDVLQITWR